VCKHRHPPKRRVFLLPIFNIAVSETLSGQINSREIPPLRSTHSDGDTGGASIALLSHNVEDMVLDLPPKEVEKIRQHYGPRAFHQLMGTRAGDIAGVPATEKTLHKMLPLLTWAKRNLGVEYVVTSPDMDQSPFAPDSSAVVVPYFSADTFGGAPMWGLDPEVAAQLKNKISFADTVMEMGETTQPIAEEYSVHPTNVLPYKTIENPDQIDAVISESLASTRDMYEQFAQFDSSVSEYPVGVVVQQMGGDGGYGTVIMRQVTDGWEILAEKDTKTYPSFDDAEARLHEIVANTGGQYKVTRYVDLTSSPSVGVYVNGADVFPLPVTMQFIEHGACVGGASQNSGNEEVLADIQQNEAYMQALSAAIVGAVLGDSTQSAHVGIDFMIAGEKERRLIELMRENPELQKYAADCMEVGIAECNPRMTSLSLSVWPLLLYDNKKSGRDRDDITYDDIRAFYGQPNAKGETGGFAVWDYIDAPDGITTETELIAWIDEANIRLEPSNIFIVPRLPLEQNGEGMNTSIVLGMRPNNSAESGPEFKRIIGRLGEQCSLQNLFA